MMLDTLFALVLFDRPITPGHFISPGGYGMRFGSKDVAFDFCDYYHGILTEDSRVLYIEHRRLDTDSYPDAESVTAEDAIDLKEIGRFFIFTGEKEDPEIHPVKILRLSLEFADGMIVDCSDTEAVRRYVFPGRPNSAVAAAVRQEQACTG